MSNQNSRTGQMTLDEVLRREARETERPLTSNSSGSGQPAVKNAMPSVKTAATAAMAAKFIEDADKLARDTGAHAVEIQLDDEVKARLLAEKAAADAVSRVRYEHTPTDSPEARALVEANVEPMDFGDLIMRGRVSQRIRVSSSLTVTLESLTGKDNWWVHQESTKQETNLLARAWSMYAQLALALIAVNDEPLPRTRDARGNIIKAEFELCLDKVMGMPEPVLSLLLVNLNWFLDRVQQLLHDDFAALKNG